MVLVELYGDNRATCTLRVMILLEELKLKFKFNQVDLFKGEQKSEEYCALQPFGKVPAMKYGDRVIFESRAIMRYIALANREIEDFIPDFDAEMWLEVEGQEYNGPISKIVYEKMWKDGGCDEAVVKEAAGQLEKVLDVYEKQLATRKYLAGDTYSIADMAHIPYTYYLIKCGYKDMLKKRPNVYNWLKDIMRRPAVKATLDSNVSKQQLKGHTKEPKAEPKTQAKVAQPKAQMG